MKSKVAVLTVLAATLVLAPMIASAKTRHHHHHHHHHHHPAARLK
jgi:Ni/Co efflux regulator RcnB